MHTRIFKMKKARVRRRGPFPGNTGVTPGGNQLQITMTTAFWQVVAVFSPLLLEILKISRFSLSPFHEKLHVEEKTWGRPHGAPAHTPDLGWVAPPPPNQSSVYAQSRLNM